MKYKLFFVVFLFFSFLFPPALRISAIDYTTLIKDYNIQLHRKKSKIQRTDKLIKRKQAEEKSLYREIISLDRAIVQSRRALRKVQKQLTSKQAQIDEILAQIKNVRQAIKRSQDELDTVTERLDKQTALFKRHLFIRYKAGRWWALKLVLLSKNFDELTRRIELLNIISQQDKELLERIKADRQKKQKLIAELRGEKENYDNLLKIKKIEYNSILSMLQRKKAILTKYRADKARKQQAWRRIKRSRENLKNTLNRLRRESKKLNSTIVHLEAEAVKKGNFAQMKGKLPWPVRGKIITTYGKHIVDPIGGSVIYSDGIDIKAPVGTPVKVVNKGKILYAKVNGIFGLMVIVSHGFSYYTVYAHLSDVLVSVGDNVLGGQVIGHTGNTGYSDVPSLHFEVRLKGKSLNPMRWLRRK